MNTLEQSSDPWQCVLGSGHISNGGTLPLMCCVSWPAPHDLWAFSSPVCKMRVAFKGWGYQSSLVSPSQSSGWTSSATVCAPAPPSDAKEFCLHALQARCREIDSPQEQPSTNKWQ